MFLYVPKLLIRPLEAFLLGPKCNKLLCSQIRTFQRLHKQGLFASIASQGSMLGEGSPDLWRMFQFPWVLRDGGSRGEEEAETEKAKMELDTVSLPLDSGWLLSQEALGRIPESRILALPQCRRVYTFIPLPPYLRMLSQDHWQRALASQPRGTLLKAALHTQTFLHSVCRPQDGSVWEF